MSKPPFVYFRYEQAGLRIGWGYLTIVNGIPWLASTAADAQEVPAPIWKMHKLDPSLLEEESSPQHDRQTFSYRGALLAS
jgi:hypothetical protein